MTVIRRPFLITMGLLIAIVVSSCGGSAQTSQSITPKDHFNAPGNILISDQFNNRVVEVAPDGHIVWTFGSGNPTKVQTDRKSTRLNSSHQIISYAVFCLKKKKKNE